MMTRPYQQPGWANQTVVNAAGKVLVFDVEPAERSDVDVLTSETLADALREITSQLDVFDDSPETSKLRLTLTARWLTPAEFEAERAGWVE